MMLAIDLQERIALVVGGSRGIGGAITETLAQAGAVVTFTHRHPPQLLGEIENLVARTKRKGGQASAVYLDACDATGTTSLVERTVQQHGKIDILVSNVGQNVARAVENVTPEEWRRFIDINLTTAFNCVRAVLPHMVKAGYGRIIFIGSSAVYSGGGGAIDYAAGKAGLTGMAAYLSKEYTRKGILTNIVHPCLIDTNLLRVRYSDEAARAKLIAQVPVGRLGKPKDIAGLVAFLVSSHGDYICGQSILVDGGRTTHQ
jgi:NAD(P)-dependent dehydrogenase (short-subunit alcohol dehydrogenase family)